MTYPGMFREGIWWKGVGLAAVTIALGSGIPIVSCGNCACCAWGWGPTLALAYFMARESYRVSPTAMLAATGAASGLGILLYLPFLAATVALAPPPSEMLATLKGMGFQVPAEFEQALRQSEGQQNKLLDGLLQGVCWSVSLAIAGLAGGLIGGAIWRNDPPPMTGPYPGGDPGYPGAPPPYVGTPPAPPAPPTSPPA